MAESEKSGLSNTDPGEAPQGKVAEAQVEAAEQVVENTEDRIHELEKRLTKEGRSKKDIEKALEGVKSELETYRSQLAEAKRVNAQWYQTWLEKWANDDQKKTAQAQRQAEEAKTKAGASSDIWKEIAKEDDPKVKKALVRLAEQAEKDGEGVTKGQVKALKASFEPDEEEEPEEKAPKVSGARSTGSSSQSWDEKMSAAKKSKNTTEIMNLIAEKAKIDASTK